jgi:hypothetical protein
MDSTKFEHWLNKFKKNWIALDPLNAANLFSKDVEYYESALKVPCENWNKVFDLWKVIPTNQRDVTFNFTILAISENFCVANWQVERTQLPQNTKQKIDGIFVLKLNKDGLCNYFKQWRTIEEA